MALLFVAFCLFEISLYIQLCVLINFHCVFCVTQMIYRLAITYKIVSEELKDMIMNL